MTERCISLWTRVACLWRPLNVAGGALLLSGCRGERVQSALHPAGPAAEQIAWLWWFMFFLLTAVFIIVMVLLLVAVFRRPRGDREVSPLGDRFIVVAGVILPSIILVVLLIFSLETIVKLNAAAQGLARDASAAPNPPADPLTIRVIGHQWWWEVHYPDEEIIIANELYIPVGEPVRLELTSADVIHSFWVPELHGKMDLNPGLINTFWIEADRRGVYRGQCAEYCGLQHAQMAFVVAAVPPEEFDDWVADRQRPTPEPETALQQQGRELFRRKGCARCHPIRGADVTEIGPDLTHIGSRLTIGAGILANSHGNLAGWIVNPQELKPGNRMPRTFLEPEELHALMAYLETLQ